MPTAIEEYRGTDQALRFDDLVNHDRPLVIRGLVRDWPIVATAGRSDTDFATELARFDNGTPVDALLMAPQEQGIVGYNADLSAFNYEHHRVSITQVLKRLAAYSRESGPQPGLALQSALISACLPGLLEQHSLPFLDSHIEPRIWIGNQVTTPAHFDEYHNIACVICGVRRFTLFAPEQARNLYIGPLDFAPTGAAIGLARLDRPDDPRYPRLKQALAQSQVADLRPGDAIYIPPMWWHHVASMQKLNALVNYWWRPRALEGGAPNTGLGALLHCILEFKSLPPAERAAWRTLLDYYVFGEENPAAHIPDEHRGILGTLDAAKVEKLRGMIRRYL